jgi:hypothetical protein
MDSDKDEIQRLNSPTGDVAVVGSVSSREGWLEVHDTLLDLWLEIYEQHRAKMGGPVPEEGRYAILPVPVIAVGVVCQHDCDCMEDSEYIFGVAGHIEGSRHATVTLVATCESCLRETGYKPEAEVKRTPQA